MLPEEIQMLCASLRISNHLPAHTVNGRENKF